MIATNNRLIVQVDTAQKNSMLVGGVLVSTVLKYQTNYREKSPVIAKVVQANDNLKRGTYLLCHHNHFQEGSPYILQDDLYSVPVNQTIFAILRQNGKLSPVYGNILAFKEPVKTSIPLPPELRLYHKDRGLVMDGGWTKYRSGDLVFTRPSAIYEIVYIFGDVEHRICKIDSRMICGLVRSTFCI